jgi:hypothetical protein
MVFKGVENLSIYGYQSQDDPFLLFLVLEFQIKGWFLLEGPLCKPREK